MPFCAAAREACDVRERRHPVRASLVPVGSHQRLEEVVHPLTAHPLRIEILEGVQEAVDSELGNPHRVENGEVRCLSVRHRVRQCLMQCRERHGEEVHLDIVVGGVKDQLPPRAFRDDDPNLGLVWTAAEPVRVDERAAAPVANDDPFLGELRQSAADRRPADSELLTELVLGREAVNRPVAAAQDLLQEERLELVVERDWLLGIDRHHAARFATHAWQT